LRLASYMTQKTACGAAWGWHRSKADKPSQAKFRRRPLFPKIRHRLPQ
jgi:hypothetical protein